MRKHIYFMWLSETKAQHFYFNWHQTQPMLVCGSPAMMLVLNENNMISRIPNFTGWIETSVCSYKCIMEIPKAAMYTDHSFAKQRVTLHMVKTAYWGGVLYYHLSSLPASSWQTAAQSCQDIGAFLLTIYSLTEYRFVQNTFLQSFDSSISYIGLKREVITVINLIT